MIFCWSVELGVGAVVRGRAVFSVFRERRVGGIIGNRVVGVVAAEPGEKRVK